MVQIKGTGWFPVLTLINTIDVVLSSIDIYGGSFAGVPDGPLHNYYFITENSRLTDADPAKPYKYVGDERFTMYDETLCPQQNVTFIKDIIVAPYTTDRAIQSTPPQFRVTTSKIPGAGSGVIAVEDIPEGAWMGPYAGEVVYNWKYIHNNAEYGFQIKIGDRIEYYIDAWSPETSNWLRYVNCARDMGEQNLEFLQCYDRVYYRTIRPIKAGEELLIFYGFGYIKRLKLEMQDYCKWYNGTFYNSVDSDFICDEDYWPL